MMKVRELRRLLECYQENLEVEIEGCATCLHGQIKDVIIVDVDDPLDPYEPNVLIRREEEDK